MKPPVPSWPGLTQDQMAGLLAVDTGPTARVVSATILSKPGDPLLMIEYGLSPRARAELDISPATFGGARRHR